jgi:hypothetical protein
MTIVLPKNRISWSQMNCWMTNPARFRREYLESGPKLDTKYLKFGKGFAGLLEALKKNPELITNKEWSLAEFGIDVTNENVKEVLEKLQRYEIHEHEIISEVAGVPILSYLDGYDQSTNTFGEYKTGKIAWTQAKVQKHDQLTFYAVALKWSTGITPDSCDLHWIETKEAAEETQDFWRGGEKKINVTGRVVSFHREFDEREIDRMEQLIIRSATEISDAYKKYIEEI